MAPRPFPSLFRIGIDNCHIPRIRKTLVDPEKTNTRAHIGIFLRRLLGDRVRFYFHRKYAKLLRQLDEEPWKLEFASARNIANYLAGRWAAKEACIKAVKPRKISLHDVEVWQDTNSELYAIILDERTAAQEPAVVRYTPQGPALGSYFTQDYINKTEADGSSMGFGDDSRGDGGRPREPSHENITGQIVRLSISHDENYACAVALAPSEPATNDVGSEAAARQPSGE